MQKRLLPRKQGSDKGQAECMEKGQNRRRASTQMKSMTTLHLPRLDADGFGWGIFCKNMRKALSGYFDMTDGPADIVLMPLADHEFNPASLARGTVNLSMAFFEYALHPKVIENAALYDANFVGSSWCLERIKELGIQNGRVLIQGVDGAIFKPQRRTPDGKFRIFTGGKFEWRKGQDLVIAAFRLFATRHPEAHLVCAWNNPWIRELLGTMIQSPHIRLDRVSGNTQEEFYRNLLNANGLSDSQFTILPALPQPDLAREMANTDIGLFPNRCEGGTNLVLMEYASIGRPVVANVLTGHADVAGAISHKINAFEDENHWADQSISDILAALEDAYQNPKPPSHTGWTWEQAAITVASSIL